MCAPMLSEPSGLMGSLTTHCDDRVVNTEELHSSRTYVRPMANTDDRVPASTGQCNENGNHAQQRKQCELVEDRVED